VSKRLRRSTFFLIRAIVVHDYSVRMGCVLSPSKIRLLAVFLPILPNVWRLVITNDEVLKGRLFTLHCILSLTGLTLVLIWQSGVIDWRSGLTNYCPSVLWCCLLGHLTSKIVPQYDLNVFGGTSNATQSISHMNTSHHGSSSCTGCQSNNKCSTKSAWSCTLSTAELRHTSLNSWLV